MAGLAFQILFIGAMVALAIGIAAMCVEMVIRLMAKGLGSELSTETTIDTQSSQQVAFR